MHAKALETSQMITGLCLVPCHMMWKCYPPSALLSHRVSKADIGSSRGIECDMEEAIYELSLARH